ncbi:exported hypothetical protein [Candidatus Sulfopaludibacter sp. SbA4]|nr:exported hypothetical protein [Candidatus Sulfopaludibacter sp. SbA4]
MISRIAWLPVCLLGAGLTLDAANTRRRTTLLARHDKLEWKDLVPPSRQ